MPAHRPQATQARLSSATALSAGGAPSRGLRARKSLTARLMKTTHLDAPSDPFSDATRVASARRAAAASARSVGNAITSACVDISSTIGATCAKNGRLINFYQIGNRRFRALATVARAGQTPHPAGPCASFIPSQVGFSPRLRAGDAAPSREYDQRSAAAFLYAPSRPHNTAPGLLQSGRPSAAEMPMQMVSQAVRDQRFILAAHASEARDQFTTNSGEPFTSPRRVSSIEASQHKSKGLGTVGLRQVGQILPVFSCNCQGSQLTTTRPTNTPDRLTEQVIGGFHDRPSFNAPSLEALSAPRLEAR